MQEKIEVIVGSDPLIVFSGQAEFILAVAHLCRNEGKFVDVTIKCSDGELQAHKIILGSASVFLRDILLSTNDDHDTFLLDGYSVSIVSLVLDFLYTGQLVVTRQETPEVQSIFTQLGINPGNVSSEDLYPLNEDSLPLNSPENEQAEITFTESNEIIDLDLKVEVSSENEGEEEKENGSSFVNTPIRKRAASTGSKLSNKKAKSIISDKEQKKSRNSKNRSNLGVHDMARVETWLCSICMSYNPPLTLENIRDDADPDDIDWIGCDCARWYHVGCTKIEVNTESFSCKDIKFKCLKPL